MTMLAGLPLDDLRLHLAKAEQYADLADYIDDTERMLSERRYWTEAARQIREEIKRRQEDPIPTQGGVSA